MNLRFVSTCQNVAVYVSLRGMLPHVIAKSGDDDAIVAFPVIIGLWLMCRGRDVYNPLDLADMSRES